MATVISGNPPGYVGYPVPLSLFVVPRLNEACSLLEQGQLSAAHEVFRNYLRNHPNDLPALVGFVQSNTSNQVPSLSEYKETASADKVAVDDLKLGLAAVDLVDSFQHYQQYRHGVKSGVPLTREHLVKIARSRLLAAYSRSHSPVVGFVLANSFFYTGGGDGVSIYEDIMRRLGGPSVYQAYLRAKMHDWNAPQPPVPNLSLHDLLIFRRAVGGIWSLYGATSSHAVERKVDGVAETQEYTSTLGPSSVGAMNFLDQWRQRIQGVADNRGD